MEVARGIFEITDLAPTSSKIPDCVTASAVTPCGYDLRVDARQQRVQTHCIRQCGGSEVRIIFT
jgi:hypothetical protein